MKSYEGMFIFKPDLTKEEAEKVLGQVKDILKKNNGSPKEIKETGKQKLTYPIKKYKEGLYYLINFDIKPDSIAKIKRAFSLNESIVRELIVKL